MGPKALQ